MKPLCIIALLLSIISCREETETLPVINSKLDCIVPNYSAIPKNGFKNEDSIKVEVIVQLR